jgi:flagellar L-ring protein precursor FlgH
MLGIGLFLPMITPVHADDLYRPGLTQSLGSDRRAAQVGDMVTIVVVQAAESSTTMQNGSRRSSAISGRFGAGSIDEAAGLSLSGNFDGRGEVRRSERFVTQMTALIADVLPNGDYRIDGSQQMRINGEETVVGVRGRIRQSDIDGENRVASNRIAEAQISYNGKGFVSRGSRPGIFQRIFGALGLM